MHVGVKKDGRARETQQDESGKERIKRGSIP